ncbi:nitroreductase family protein [candidate division KSB1 bacterium]|nr:nitroreductase family protein [candidate division KSB1 bacterium]
MDFFDVIAKRVSVRAYESTEVEAEKLDACLNAANLAPSAVNRQPFRFIVVHTAGREEELRRIYHREWFSRAPLVVAAVAVPEEGWNRRDGKNYAVVDTTIAMDHFILAAAAQGLGTCWVAAFDPQAAHEILGLPENAEPVAFTPLGYPADPGREKKRKTLSEWVRYEQW